MIVYTVLCYLHIILQYALQLTYVDIIILGVMRPIASLYPEEYKSLDIPLLRGFTERMESRPNIASYLKSPRSQPYSDNSLM